MLLLLTTYGKYRFITTLLLCISVYTIYAQTVLNVDSYLDSMNKTRYSVLGNNTEDTIVLNSEHKLLAIYTLCSHCCQPTYWIVTSNNGNILAVNGVNDFNAVAPTLYHDYRRPILLEKAMLYLLLKNVWLGDVCVSKNDYSLEDSWWVGRIICPRIYNIARKYKRVQQKGNNVIIPTTLFSDKLCMVTFRFSSKGELKKVVYREYCQYRPHDMDDADKMQAKDKCHPRTKIVKVER